MDTKILSLTVFFALLILPTTIGITSPISLNGAVYESNIESTAYTEGIIDQITVAEDIGVVNGTYQDTNLDIYDELYIGTAFDGPDWLAGRSWLRFNLSEVNFPFYRAIMYVYISGEWGTTDDEPIGAYYCSDDSWEVSVITWNNQPSITEQPTDVINSPASPDMFITDNWYGWDITEDVQATVSGDKILTEVLKQTEEVGTQSAFKYSLRSSYYPSYAAYIEFYYSNPSTDQMSVDGKTSSPLIDYIQDPTPTLGWHMSESLIGDYQTGYNVEVWDNEFYNSSQLFSKSTESKSLIYDSGTISGGNTHPFGIDDEMRHQLKFPSELLPRSGIIDKLYFNTTQESGTLNLEDFEISLVMVADTDNLTTTFANNYDGRTPTVVLAMDNYEVSYSDHTLIIDVENTFMVNNYLNLIIEIRLMNNTGDLTQLRRAISTGPGSVAGVFGTGAYSSEIASYTVVRTYDLTIGFVTEEVYSIPVAGLNAFPFGTTVGHSGLFQIKYNQSVIDRSGHLDKIYFRVSTLTGNVVFENFTVSVVETPEEGNLVYDDFTTNYGGITPTVVIDESIYEVQNIGNCLVLDFDNIFYYHNQYDLLIEFRWDSLVSGAALIPNNQTAAVCYRAWDVHWNGLDRLGEQAAGYDFMIDFIESDTSLEYSGEPLTTGTTYYWRVQVCNSYGIWSDWATQSFTYHPLTSGPEYEGPIVTPTPVYIGYQFMISINVTYILDISEVTIDFGGTSYPMLADGDTYTYNMTATEAGILNFTIYMESVIGTSTSVDGNVTILLPRAIIPSIPLLPIIAAVSVGAIIVIVVIIKMKSPPKT
ncbi:DNRLRE domain-containing protein [Candidatus Thorarchaeota archaeon]|nr:MAG: DNRLRE domain-containing protein [Candidatus Thorarchaeota archaeon]